jgi:methyl-accepting chemotaxis protein
MVAAEAISALDEIRRAVELSHQGITALSENSGRIDGIITVINEVTKRTNLLALNASIIAAQAGVQGASFGVVAEEIRNLSLKTGKSTGEITDIIEQVRAESRQAAEQIAFTKELVHRGVASGRQMAAALDMIHARSEESMNMTREIRNATQDEVKSVQFVAKSMEEVRAMTARIAEASQEQNASLKRIVQVMEAIKGLSHDMVRSSNRQADGGNEINRSLESVSAMLREMLETMEKRREQSAHVVSELELLR